MKHRAAATAAVVSAACFGTLAILTSLMYEAGAEPLQVLSWRFAMACVLLGTFMAVRRPGSLRVSRASFLGFARLSVFGYGAASLCFFFALRYADPAVVAILLYTYPALIVVFEALKERTVPDSTRLVAVVLTFIGCALVVDPFGGQLSVQPVGIALGLGAGVGYASFSVLSHRLMEGNARGVIMTYLFGFTALLAGVVAVASGSTLSVAAWGSRLWTLLGLLVVVPTFAAVILYLRAVQALGASQAALLSTFEPVFTLAMAVTVLGDTLSAPQWMGAVLVIVGVIIAEKTGAATEPAAP